MGKIQRTVFGKRVRTSEKRPEPERLKARKSPSGRRHPEENKVNNTVPMCRYASSAGCTKNPRYDKDTGAFLPRPCHYHTRYDECPRASLDDEHWSTYPRRNRAPARHAMKERREEHGMIGRPKKR